MERESLLRQREEMVKRMRDRAQWILFSGICVGVLIILPLLLGTPLPASWCLAMILCLAAFLAFQFVQIFRVLALAKVLNEKINALPSG